MNFIMFVKLIQRPPILCKDNYLKPYINERNDKISKNFVSLQWIESAQITEKTSFSLGTYELRNAYNVRIHEKIIHRYFINPHAVFMS